MSSRKAVARLRFGGAAPRSDVVGLGLSSGRCNYFRGDDPEGWRRDIPTFGAVARRSVYPGIDVVYRAGCGGLEYDFVLKPGARPETIVLGFDGVTSMALDGGDLLLETRAGVVRQRKPLAYQEVDGARCEIAAGYTLSVANEVGFVLGPYDRDRPLVIDPTLVYSTYFGGSVGDEAHAIAVDDKGSVYIAGTTGSTDFPTVQAAQPLLGGQRDAFVAKFDPSGSLVYATYLGASGWEEGAGVAADRLGNAYVTGRTSSTDFPTLNPAQANHGGGMYDAFVAKLDPSGSLVYSTYLGGSADDVGSGIAVDRSFRVYVTGSTFSSDFPTQNALQPTHGGGYDAFVTKLGPSGSVDYSTFLGGSGDEHGHAIGVHGKGQACVVGETASDDFPTKNAIQKKPAGSVDAFVAMLGSSGSSLSYSTYLGGKDFDAAYGVAVESQGSVHITGITSSDDFPTANPVQAARAGFVDAFVAKLNANGSVLVYSTYLGGSDFDAGHAIAFDRCGNPYVTGITKSTDFPTVDALQATLGGGTSFDAFVAKLKKDGSALVYSTYLGGSDVDQGDGIASQPPNWLSWLLCALPGLKPSVYVTGTTYSKDFPTANPAQANNAGVSSDAFVAKIT